MAKGKRKTEIDDLSIPAFLLVKNRPKRGDAGVGNSGAVVPFVEPWRRRLDAVEPPALREFIELSIRRGRFEREWLVVSHRRTEKDIERLIAAFRGKQEEHAEKQERQREQLKRLRENRPKKVSPLAGLIPLRKVLEEMGDKAPPRRHAMAAIDEAKIEHTKYHFSDNVVTLARVRQILSTYSPPEKKRGVSPQFSAEAVIMFEGENPKKPGSSAHGRWELLRGHHRKTVGQFLEAHGNPVTLQNAILQKRVVLREGKMKK